ncbi:MAG: hypothetical protein K9N34_01940 [Candidatus Marinimicrobia bacterium]|nr:hypothetical protein [Candidatus Neomarinimicrobiota bacterium]
MAKPVQVSVNLDTTDGTLGDVFQANWQVSHSQDEKIVFPPLEERIGTFEILDQQRTSLEEYIVSWQLAVAVYDSVGPHDFPDLTAAIISGGDTNAIKLPGFQVEIHSILTAADSTFRPIKPIHSVRLPFNWWYVVYGVLAITVIYLIYRFWPRRRGGKRQPREKVIIIPPEEAHVVALRELKALEGSGYLEQGAFKIFYSELTAILRKYFENRFLIDALEMTTTEVLQALRADILTPDEFRDAEAILEQGDLVKFAKFIPTSSETKKALNLAFELVEETRIQSKTTRQNSEKTQQAEVEDIS